MGWNIFNSIKEKQHFAEDLHCPWEADCPSHTPFKDARKPKLRLLERVGPMTKRYRCEWCGMEFLTSNEPGDTRQKAHILNPSLIGGDKII